MTPEQALELLARMSSMTPATAADHDARREAVNILAAVVQPPTPERDPPKGEK